MRGEVVLTVPGFGSLAGSHPLVIIGPNGSGKTRLGIDLASQSDAEHIAALRNIQLNQQINMRPIAGATKELTQNLTRRRSRPWEMSNEIDLLFSKLLAEDSASATRYRDQCAKGERPEIENTKIRVLRELWRRFFPGRDLDLSNYAPIVRSSHRGSMQEYSAHQMSDGERVALYLAARVLDTDKDAIVVDEPEVHFHSRLAIRFWNELETLRADCRFIYVTHDLSFALSRKNGQFVIVQAGASPAVLPREESLPKDVAETILGAASFSVVARHVIFCEGSESGSLDYQFFSSWFSDPETVVVPVGSCDQVVQSAMAFANSSLVTGMTCMGIVDRDYWPDSYLSHLCEPVHVLPLHELESLLCLKDVFQGIASHQAIDADQIESLYSSAVIEEKSTFRDGKLCHLVNERVKKRLERELLPILNSLGGSNSLPELREKYLGTADLLKDDLSIPSMFDEERKAVEQALASTEESTYLQLLPGKGFEGTLAKAVGLSRSSYEHLICRALAATENSDLRPLGDRLRSALGSHLPPAPKSGIAGAV